MNVLPQELADVLLIEPVVLRDERGFFLETWHADKFRAAGLDWDFVQDNQSRSTRGTLRGLHYQIIQPQGKLVRVVHGEIFDVAVDLRRSSATFGRWIGVTLSGERGNQLWIPPGFAHGFYVTSESADVVYKCTTPYIAAGDRSVRWNDAAIGVRWPIPAGTEPLLSRKDAAAPMLASAETFG